jgi:kumamolisin
LAVVYHFPATTGAGQTIGIIELGGGFRYSDLHNYWKSLGFPGDVRTTPLSVNGAANKPEGTPDGADGEVVLDIEVAGGIAPGAKLAVYFAPNTDQGFLNAINTAIHDKVLTPLCDLDQLGLGGAKRDSTVPGCLQSGFPQRCVTRHHGLRRGWR